MRRPWKTSVSCVYRHAIRHARPLLLVLLVVVDSFRLLGFLYRPRVGRFTVTSVTYSTAGSPVPKDPDRSPSVEQSDARGLRLADAEVEAEGGEAKAYEEEGERRQAVHF